MTYRLPNPVGLAIPSRDDEKRVCADSARLSYSSTAGVCRPTFRNRRFPQVGGSETPRADDYLLKATCVTAQPLRAALRYGEPGSGPLELLRSTPVRKISLHRSGWACRTRFTPRSCR